MFYPTTGVCKVWDPQLYSKTMQNSILSVIVCMCGKNMHGQTLHTCLSNTYENPSQKLGCFQPGRGGMVYLYEPKPPFTGSTHTYYLPDCSWKVEVVTVWLYQEYSHCEDGLH